MAKHQTRRSVSLNREIFERASAAATQDGIPLAKFTETALDAWIKAAQLSRARKAEAAGRRGPTPEQLLELDEIELANAGDPMVEYDEP